MPSNMEGWAESLGVYRGIERTGPYDAEEARRLEQDIATWRVILYGPLPNDPVLAKLTVRRRALFAFDKAICDADPYAPKEVMEKRIPNYDTFRRQRMAMFRQEMRDSARLYGVTMGAHFAQGIVKHTRAVERAFGAIESL